MLVIPFHETNGLSLEYDYCTYFEFLLSFGNWNDLYTSIIYLLTH